MVPVGKLARSAALRMWLYRMISAWSWAVARRCLNVSHWASLGYKRTQFDSILTQTNKDLSETLLNGGPLVVPEGTDFRNLKPGPLMYTGTAANKLKSRQPTLLMIRHEKIKKP